ncbi:TOMM precursor leader peptide-binding protein [Nonomuraea angiospora]|uniref:TOMM precursor leader peptide-binding protein n=1 Tax=Nonomuraea angiospora TaxID=46172 RepID=UPI003450885D
MTAIELEVGGGQAKPPGADDFAVRPRLGHDVLFYDVGDKVVVRNPEKVYVVKGQWAYRFICSLAPYLTGEYTVGELCAELAPERQAMVVSLVRSLIDRGFARNVRPSGDVDLEPAVEETFASQLNYVEHFVDEAKARFLRFRTAKVLMLGTGRVNRAAAESLLRNGLGSLSLVASSPDSAAEDTAVARAGLAECVADLTEAGCPPRVRPLDLTVEDALASHALIGYDYVIASGDDIGMAALRRLIDAGVHGGPVVLPATSIGSRVVIGPVTRPATAGCWMCAMLRYAANAESRDAVALWHGIACGDSGPGAPRLNPQLAAMVGNMLAFDLFRLATGCFAAETDQGVLIQHISTLEAKRERLWPHPLCPSCAEHQDLDAAMPVTPAVVHEKAPRPFGADREDADREDADREDAHREDKERLRALLKEADELTGFYTGVLSSFEDMALDQSPLKVGRVRLGAQAGPDLRTRLITAFDLHYVPVARRSALRAALLAYVGQVANVRHAVTGSTELRHTLAPTDLFTSTGLAVDGRETLPWLPATSLVSGEQRLMPAAAVHPWSALNADALFERSGAGDGAGATMGEAVRAGLLSAVAFEALREAVSGRGEPRPILCGDPETGSELEFLLRTFDNLDVWPEVLEISRRRDAGVVLARIPGSADRPLWTVRAALSREAALVGALRDLAGLVQLRHLAKEEEADLGEPLLPGFDARAVHATGDPLPASTDDAPGDVAGLVGELAGEGRDVLVVDTTTPELRSQTAVVTCRVLLARCEK